MNTLSAIQSQYNAIAGLATPPRRNVADIAADLAPAPAAEKGAPPGSVKISISAAAYEAAKNDAAGRPGLPLPESVRQWFDKEFSPDVLDEAKSRLQAIQANGELGALGPMNLPLLPENQQLLASFHAEMAELSADGHANMNEEQTARYNQLMNLGFRLQLTGWQQPMTEADVQREFDISNAMGKLAYTDPSLKPPAPAPVSAQQVIADSQAGRVPIGWRQRWESEGLAMPADIVVAPEGSLWLDLAAAAGIEEDDFMTQVRELAAQHQGHALTRAVEDLISTRYLAKQEAARAQAG